MSTIKTTNIGHPSAGSDAITLSSSGAIEINGAMTGAGLDLITSQDFNVMSNVSINNCFTSTYENYLILVRVTSLTSDQVCIRLRASGTDVTTGYYFNGPAFNTSSDTTIVMNRSAGNSNRFILEDGQTSMGSHINLFSPQLTQVTHYIGHTNAYSTVDINGYNAHGLLNNSNSYDGFTLYTLSSNTMTGTLRVYGYRNS